MIAFRILMLLVFCFLLTEHSLLTHVNVMQAHHRTFNNNFRHFHSSDNRTLLALRYTGVDDRDFFLLMDNLFLSPQHHHSSVCCLLGIVQNEQMQKSLQQLLAMWQKRSRQSIKKILFFIDERSDIANPIIPLFTLLSYASTRTDIDFNFIFFVTIGVVPLVKKESIVDQLIRAVGSAAAISCVGTHWQNSTSGLRVIDKGFELLSGHDKDGSDTVFAVRRQSGVLVNDDRAKSIEFVALISTRCLLLRLGAVEKFPLKHNFSGEDDAVIQVNERHERHERLRKTLLHFDFDQDVKNLPKLIANRKATTFNPALLSNFHEAIHQSVVAQREWELETGRKWELEKLQAERRGEISRLSLPMLETNRTLMTRLKIYKWLLKRFCAKPDESRIPIEEIDGWVLSMLMSAAGERTVVAPIFYVVRPRYLEASDFRTSYQFAKTLALYNSFAVSARQIENSMNLFYQKHNEQIDVEMKQTLPLVVWNTVCCHCCGFSSEILHFLFPLQRYQRVRSLVGPHCFCQGAPAVVMDSLARLHISIEDTLVEYKPLIWISHMNPTLWNEWKTYRADLPAGSYHIGRIMYEFTKIPSEWFENIDLANEIWVPGEWVKEVFVMNGVDRQKIYVIPEGIDTDYHNPSIADTTAFPPSETYNKYCNRRLDESDRAHFIFFSHFKWETRKGWDILFDAYSRAFEPNERVSLYILTYMFYTDGRSDLTNLTHAIDQLKGYFLVKGKSLEELPHFCLVAELVDEDTLLSFHNSADAFVLPTRGEGWGLPIVHAMSLGKPVIATYWSGPTSFLSPECAFLIPIEGVEELPHDSVYGWEPGKKWCIPSTRKTVELMQLVFSQREFGKKIGERARQHVIKNFNEDAVARIVDNRLRHIEKKLQLKNAF